MICKFIPPCIDVAMPPISDNPPHFINLVALDVSALSYAHEGAPIIIDLTDHSNKGVSAKIVCPNLDGVLELLKETYGHRYSLLLVHESIDVGNILK